MKEWKVEITKEKLHSVSNHITCGWSEAKMICTIKKSLEKKGKSSSREIERSEREIEYALTISLLVKMKCLE
jgi:hypothetical protein